MKWKKHIGILRICSDFLARVRLGSLRKASIETEAVPIPVVEPEETSAAESEYLVRLEQLKALHAKLSDFQDTLLWDLTRIMQAAERLWKEEPSGEVQDILRKLQNLLGCCRKTKIELSLHMAEELGEHTSHKQSQKVWAVIDRELAWYFRMFSDDTDQLFVLKEYCEKLAECEKAEWFSQIPDVADELCMKAVRSERSILAFRERFPCCCESDAVPADEEVSTEAFPKKAAGDGLFQDVSSNLSDPPDQGAVEARRYAEYTQKRVRRRMHFPPVNVEFGSAQWYAYAKYWACDAIIVGTPLDFLFQTEGVAARLRKCLGDQCSGQGIHVVQKCLVIDDEPFLYYGRSGGVEYAIDTTMPPYQVRFDIAFAVTPGNSMIEYYCNYLKREPSGRFLEAIDAALQNARPDGACVSASELRSRISMVVSLVSEQVNFSLQDEFWLATGKMCEKLSDVLEQAFCVHLDDF